MRAQYIGKAQIVLLVIMILLGCILICSASECGVAAADERGRVSRPRQGSDAAKCRRAPGGSRC